MRLSRPQQITQRLNAFEYGSEHRNRIDLFFGKRAMCRHASGFDFNPVKPFVGDAELKFTWLGHAPAPPGTRSGLTESIRIRSASNVASSLIFPHFHPSSRRFKMKSSQA